MGTASHSLAKHASVLCQACGAGGSSGTPRRAPSWRSGRATLASGRNGSGHALDVFSTKELGPVSARVSRSITEYRGNVERIKEVWLVPSPISFLSALCVQYHAVFRKCLCALEQKTHLKSVQPRAPRFPAPPWGGALGMGRTPRPVRPFLGSAWSNAVLSATGQVGRSQVRFPVASVYRYSE
eukprot:gene12700-biopygen14042